MLSNPLYSMRLVALLGLTAAVGTLGAEPLVFSREKSIRGPAVTVNSIVNDTLGDADTAFFLGTGASFDQVSLWNGTNQESAGHFFVLGVVGVTQGLLAHEKDSKALWENRNLLQGFAAYREEFHGFTGASGGFDSGHVPGTAGYFQGSLQLGLEWSTVSRRNSRGLNDGIAVELVGEVGQATRVTTTTSFFWPLYDAQPTSNSSVFSLELVGLGIADQILSEDSPIIVRQGVGGRNPRWGAMGSLVRGVESGRYGGRFKAVYDAELRVNLPALTFLGSGSPGGVTPYPGVLAYFDTGVYGASAWQIEGLLASSGVGVYLNVFDFVQVVFTKPLWVKDQPVPGTSFLLGLGWQI